MDSLSQTLTRHMIFIQRYAGGEFKRLVPVLREMLIDVRRAMTNAPPSIVGILTQTEREIKLLIDLALNKLSEQLQETAKEFSAYEAEFTSRMLNKYLTVQTAGIDIAQIQAAVTTTPMQLIKGKGFDRLTLQQAVEHFNKTASKEILQAVRLGVVSGKPTQNIVKEVSDLVNTRTKRQAEALVRTSVNHIAAETRKQVFLANKEVLEKERFIATLDSRTTLTCAGFDGKSFDVGQGPIPPLHWNCRSTRVPVVAEQFRVPGMKMERASYEGPVDGRVTYGGFLKRQSVEFQNEVLGKRRAELFRAGKISIEGFTDDSGRVLTLKELATKERITL